MADLHESGRLTVLDLAPKEFSTFGPLTSQAHCGDLGLRFPLDLGEAACLAIAVGRGTTLVTDDGDARGALQRLAPDHLYERIRRLLLAAAERELCTRDRANAVHREMRRLGLWDTADL